MNRILILFGIIALTIAQKPILQSAQLFSTVRTIDPGTTHSFLLDFSCISTSGTILIDVNQPAFDNKFGGVFAYVSNKPSTGPYEPFPNPGNQSSYQYTTFKGNAIPLPGVVIPNATPTQYYILITTASASSPQYELSAEIVPKTLSAVGKVEENPAVFTFKPTFPITAPKQQDLFFSNKAVFNSSVNWGTYVQFALPLCPSAIAKISNTVCLSVILTGLDPSFLFFQKLSVDPDPYTINYWQTRPSPPDGNPYTDQSGSSRLPINIYYSLPTAVAILPSVLYHTINGEGGQGLNPPYPNFFSVYYQIVPCSV